MADLTSFPESPGAVVIKLGNGDGTFTSLNPILFPQMAAAIAAGDFNGDGKPDLVISEFSNGVGILYGNGDGTFQVSPTNFVTGTGPSSIAVGDFNGDGLLDLAVTNTGNGTVSALLGVNTACGVTAAANAAVFDNNGGNVSVAVTASTPSCNWSATVVQNYSSSSTPPIAGVGTATIDVAIPPNGTGADETATITVGNTQIPIVVEATQQQFTDVPPGAFAFDAINLMKQYGVTDGGTATTFCPVENVTRAQIASLPGEFDVRSIASGGSANALLQRRPTRQFRFCRDPVDRGIWDHHWLRWRGVLPERSRYARRDGGAHHQRPLRRDTKSALHADALLHRRAAGIVRLCADPKDARRRHHDGLHSHDLLPGRRRNQRGYGGVYHPRALQSATASGHALH